MGFYFRSAYQLLPIVNNKCFPRPGWETAVEYRTKTGIPGNLNLFDADWWRELGWPVQLKDNNERDQFLKNELPQLLAEAEKFLCDVSDYNLASKFKVVHIYGFKQDTVCRIIFDEKNRSGSTLPPVIEPLCKGDGTVPEWIASDKHRPGLIRNFDGELHAQLVAATEFGLYLEDLRNELVDEFSKKVLSQKGGEDAATNLFVKLKFPLPSMPSVAGADPKSSQVAEKVIEQLHVSPEKEIYRPARERLDADDSRRAVAYRVFADVRKADQRSRAWALSNAAHIKLTQKDFNQALKLSKRALELAGDVRTTDTRIKKDLVRLRSKAAWTAAISAEKLEQKTEAAKFRKIAADNGNPNTKLKTVQYIGKAS